MHLGWREAIAVAQGQLAGLHSPSLRALLAVLFPGIMHNHWQLLLAVLLPYSRYMVLQGCLELLQLELLLLQTVLQDLLGLLQIELLLQPMDKTVEPLGWLALEDFSIEVLGLVEPVPTVVAVSLSNWSLELGGWVLNPHHWHQFVRSACERVQKMTL